MMSTEEFILLIFIIYVSQTVKVINLFQFLMITAGILTMFFLLTNHVNTIYPLFQELKQNKANSDYMHCPFPDPTITIDSVIADACQFYQGSTAVHRTCSNGCCENQCCSDDYKTLAIILGTVFGCLLVIIIVTLVVVYLTRNRWSKKIKPQKEKRNNTRNGESIELGKMTKVSN